MTNEIIRFCRFSVIFIIFSQSTAKISSSEMCLFQIRENLEPQKFKAAKN